MRADNFFWNNRSFVDPGLCLLSTLIAKYYFEVSIDFKRLIMAKRRCKLPTCVYLRLCLTRTSAHLRWIAMTRVDFNRGGGASRPKCLPSGSHASLSRLNYSTRRSIELIETTWPKETEDLGTRMGFVRLACTVRKFIFQNYLRLRLARALGISIQVSTWPEYWNSDDVRKSIDPTLF